MIQHRNHISLLKNKIAALIQTKGASGFRSLNLKALATVVLFATCLAAKALPVETYTKNSVLAEGNWVKISIPRSGLYKISASQLKQWGFADINSVHIYGYGGNRIPDRLSASNYIDDLPLVQCEKTADAIVFYGVGPDSWVRSEANLYRINNNIYTTKGYYFLSDRPLADGHSAPEIKKQGTPSASNPATTFVDRVHYEVDAVSVGEAGWLLVGENLKAQNDREFTFYTPDHVDDLNARLECAVAVKNYENTSLNYWVNGTKLQSESSDKINAISTSHYVHAGYTVSQKSISYKGSELKIKVGINGINQVKNAWLDYLVVNYTRKLSLPSAGILDFWSESADLKLDNASADVRVWDVTTPSAVTALNAGASGNALAWRNEYGGSGMRSYVAWSPSGKIPAPAFEGNLSTQNIHGMDCVDMVIFTLPEFKAQAERLAQVHRTSDHPLSVAVLNVDDVYNEFASGCADVSAMRKCLKMFYDRGLADGKEVKYALIMGRSTYDNRHLTSQFAEKGAFNTVPAWYGMSAKSQFSDNDAFGTDDFIAMLDDDSGTALGIDNISVALGRIPVTSANEAARTIDKIERYLRESKSGTWKNSFIFLADDGDSGIHAIQTEGAVAELLATENGQNFVNKVYIDAYDLISGVCEGGRRDLYRLLDEGAMWLHFSGHANNHSWTGEGILTYTDINNMYLKKIPVLMAATCDFLRWDSQTMSGGEIMFHEPNGGTIATISATRPVYISDNGLLTLAFGRNISKRNPDGTLPRLGDIYRNAKNNILNDKGEHRSNQNRLRFVLMGDPALMLVTPSNIVTLDEINGISLSADEQVTLKAYESATLSGCVRNPQGEVLNDFNGTVQINLYDAERSTTTKGADDENIELTFQQHGDLLYSGFAKVTNGRFDCKVTMPGEIADNFRPALANMYAQSTDGSAEAVGVNTGFYVYGLDENAQPDTQAPEIHYFVLNEENFSNGDNVNTSPMVLAKVSDDVSINLSSAGIGHQMTLTLDGRKTYTNVSLYFTPNSDGTPGGTIAYPLENLNPGHHTLTLRVWDTSANSASQTLDFTAVENLAPTIYKVYTDENPASTQARFYIQHNRPDAQVSATIMVYDLLGRRVWETSLTVPSDMHTSYPVVWNLEDLSGRRVPRGIYLYRATLSTPDGDSYDTASQRLAVTAP